MGNILIIFFPVSQLVLDRLHFPTHTTSCSCFLSLCLPHSLSKQNKYQTKKTNIIRQQMPKNKTKSTHAYTQRQGIHFCIGQVLLGIFFYKTWVSPQDPPQSLRRSVVCDIRVLLLTLPTMVFTLVSPEETIRKCKKVRQKMARDSRT